MTTVDDVVVVGLERALDEWIETPFWRPLKRRRARRVYETFVDLYMTRLG